MLKYLDRSTEAIDMRGLKPDITMFSQNAASSVDEN